MHRMQRLSYHVAPLLALALSACGAGTTVGEASPALTINPVGVNTGALVVDAPVGLTPPANPTNSPWLVIYRATDPTKSPMVIQLGVPTQLDPSANYCIVLGPSWGAPRTSDCSINVVAGKTTTYNLSALQLRYDPSLTTTEFGGLYTSTLKTDTNQATAWWNLAAPDASGAVWYLVLPGPYQLTWSLPAESNANVPPPVTTTIAPGALFAWDLQLTEWRFRIHIVPPARQFPDVSGSYYGSGDTYSITSGTYAITDGSFNWVAYPTPQTDQILYLPPGPDNYTLAVFGVPWTIAAGAPNTQIDITPQRIDVAPVTYNKSDGSLASVSGSWSLTRLAGAPGPTLNVPVSFKIGFPLGCIGNANCNSPGNWTTGSGVDVIPGSYTGSVSFDESDLGGTETDTFNVTF